MLVTAGCGPHGERSGVAVDFPRIGTRETKCWGAVIIGGVNNGDRAETTPGASFYFVSGQDCREHRAQSQMDSSPFTASQPRLGIRIYGNGKLLAAVLGALVFTSARIGLLE